MARPKKTGLEYFSTDTNKYHDIRIKRLKRVHKRDGIAIYDYILCEIYRDKGCYLDWDETICFDVAEYFEIDEKIVEQVVLFCCEIGLFDMGLFDKISVLTSKSIQERYSEVVKTAKRKNCEIPKNIDLSRSLFRKIQEETPPKPEETTGIKEETHGKREESTQSKVKESIVKENKVFIKVRGEVFDVSSSTYLQQNCQVFLDQWQGKHRDISLNDVLKKMDSEYICYDFSDENHLTNAFKFSYEKLKKERPEIKQTTTPLNFGKK